MHYAIQIYIKDCDLNNMFEIKPVLYIYSNLCPVANRNEGILTVHETLRNASVIKSTNAATPLT